MMKALVMILALAGQDGDGPDLIDSLEKGYRQAMKKAAPSVVSILVDRDKEPSKKKPKPRFNPVTRRPAMVIDVFATRPHGAWTTGTILEADGVILTTHFNVSGKVKSMAIV